jgi:hypothetical protein
MKEYLINRSDTPAFPLHNHGTQTLGMCFTGMTLRDYFAAKAMQGLISEPSTQGTMEEFANRAYKVADAMMKARGETK